MISCPSFWSIHICTALHTVPITRIIRYAAEYRTIIENVPPAVMKSMALPTSTGRIRSETVTSSASSSASATVFFLGRR